MTSLRSHIADVLASLCEAPPDDSDFAAADALLADPAFAAIIDLAAEYVDEVRSETPGWWSDPGDGVYATRRRDIVALLAAWQASRAEQEPER